MADIIQLLPDSVANQIAAGEVIQRPASAVKELMENAVDAGSGLIKVIVKDAGKTLIQIIDNGCGMSETDARMCFERHATSKIRKADDLFSIRTMGFRGEALASIAAIAHVEMKSRRIGDDFGTLIEIEGSEVKSQSACTCAEGTSFAVKNLFFNVPARRNFLKSDSVELRHIIDEFQRVALANPDISFSLHHNNNDIFHLESGTIRQRIIGIFGASFNQRLVPVEEQTNILNIVGFIGKPEFAKKTRGEQFFFLNKRFIKNPYLNHAIQTAYKEVLQSDSFPFYVIMLDIDPKTIDINIHPTKTEVKFEDEKAIYAIIRSAVKQSLGKYNIAPSLDFEPEPSFIIPLKPREGMFFPPTITVNKNFNPFKTSTETPSEISNKANWEKLYSNHNFIKGEDTESISSGDSSQNIDPQWNNVIQEAPQKVTYQLHNKYILSHIKTGFMIIEQQGAHERILYERLLDALEKNKSNSQQELFPQTLELSAGDFELVNELKKELEAIGFDIREFGKNTFIIHGMPSDTRNANAKELLEGLIEEYKQNLSDIKLDRKENLARSMARNMSVKSGKSLSTEEMNSLIDELFACKMPYSTPNGKPAITTFSMEDLDRRFKK